MTITTPLMYNNKQFSWSSRSNIMSVEASDLGWRPGISYDRFIITNDSGDRRATVRFDRMRRRVEEDGARGDVMYWGLCARVGRGQAPVQAGHPSPHLQRLKGNHMKEQLGRQRLMPKAKKDRKPKPRLRPHEYESPDGNPKKPCVYTQGRGETFQQCGLHKSYPVHDLRKPPGVGPR